MSADHDLGDFGQTPPIPRLCRYLSERSPQPMVAVEGTTHVVIYLNPAFAHLVGREKKDLLGRPFAEAVPEGDENGCHTLLDRVFRTGVPEGLAEQEHRQTQPRPVYWSYSVWAILGADERPAGVMIQVTDATETALFRRQSTEMNEALLVSSTQQHELAEVARSLSERLQIAVHSRDHFLAVLSHELRNPLAALSTGLQILKLDGEKSTESADSSALLCMMERQLNQLVWLVDDLLDVSRVSTGKLTLHKERVDLASIVSDAVAASRPLIDEHGHQLTVTVSPGPIPLDADPTRLVQVLSNLLTNAAKYSERGGHIRLTVARDGDEVVLSVKDTGIGIPAEQLAHVFEVFMQVDTAWQRMQGGMGIGLSLVKEFVGLHGGRVEALSDGPGNGSEFVVRLPTAAETTASGLPPTAAKRLHGPRRRILVVDDTKDVAEPLARLLRILGHEVRTALGGEAGVAGVATFRPEMVLMDIGMPDVDGYEAARRIRTQVGGREPYLVALTGWGSDDDRKRTLDAGFNRHLVKPVGPDDLSKIIAEMPTDSQAR